jgi:hypothetical protein
VSAACWYSWIPTNLGELNFDFIGKSKIIENNYQQIRKRNNSFYIKKLDISYISDTYTPNDALVNLLLSPFLPSFQEEIFGYADVFLIKNTFTFYGTIRLSYPENFLAKATIEIELNGKIKISNLDVNSYEEGLWSEFGDYNHFSNYLAQVIFIIIKGLIHGDNHHHQKIDTAIAVNPNQFQPEYIVQNMIRHIKRVEHDIKHLDRCYGEIKSKNSIEEMKGYRSYIKTFRLLFAQQIDNLTVVPIYVKEEKILDNIIDSLESNVKKTQNKPAHRLSFFAILLVYLGALISGSILYLNLWGKDHPSYVNNWGYYWIYATIILYIALLHLKCIIKSLVFYHNYHIYEYLFHLQALKQPTGINKIIKFFWKQKYTILAFMMTMVLLIIKKVYY